MKRMPLIKINHGERYYLKLTPIQRYQHFVLMVTFTLLVLTGFPLKFHYYDWAGPMLSMFGGIGSTTIIHRVSGVIMVGLFFYHWYYLLKSLGSYYVVPARRSGTFSLKGMMRFIYESPMFPRKKDLVDVKDFLKWAFFITNKRPRHERFHWREKFDYWAVFWGIPVLGLTGAVLWFEVQATSIMPGWMVNISYIAHSDEAMLAVAVIFIWHMYNAHVNYDKFPMSPLFLTGYLPESIMAHEYVLEWDRINRAVENDPSLILDLDEIRRESRRRVDDITTEGDHLRSLIGTPAPTPKPTED